MVLINIPTIKLYTSKKTRWTGCLCGKTRWQLRLKTKCTLAYPHLQTLSDDSEQRTTRHIWSTTFILTLSAATPGTLRLPPYKKIYHKQCAHNMVLPLSNYYLISPYTQTSTKNKHWGESDTLSLYIHSAAAMAPVVLLTGPRSCSPANVNSVVKGWWSMYWAQCKQMSTLLVAINN